MDFILDRYVYTALHHDSHGNGAEAWRKFLFRQTITHNSGQIAHLGGVLDHMLKCCRT